ncbi:hypothetical protein H5410_034807 [Solanum commersonii]|uniref:Uncharacterized protein n=1 Tax=Solanum commersonii TaxID=4109 RepID=A0A9J5YUC7_SOLCO|nr:hypothetical protein H5410_034807 [Solanum commersonii]
MSASLVVVTEFRHINIGDFANKENLTNGWDDTFNCYYINEDLSPNSNSKYLIKGKTLSLLDHNTLHHSLVVK